MARASDPSFQRQALEKIIDRFEQAWQSGAPPKIEDFLDVSSVDQQALLTELVHTDLEYRLKAGGTGVIEDYLRRFPELQDSSHRVVSLIEREFSQCRFLGRAPAVEDYLARFPQYHAELESRFDRPTPDADNTPRDASPQASNTPPTTQTPSAPESPRRIRCPHCHNPIQLASDSDEVLCPGCGSSFRLRDARHTDTTATMKSLGRFQLLERLGLGGFGAVWKARDTELDRIVALKIPHTGLLTEKEELERFKREARAAAQLRHPNIVGVHEVAIINGLPIIVYEFVQGVPLRDVLETRRLTFREAAALVATVANAVDYAHTLGVVHRDIKPSNIILERQSLFDYRRSASGQSQTDNPAFAAELSTPLIEIGQLNTELHSLGKPMVLDFGLALREGIETTLTVEGHVVGTPAYMSPEQAAGQGHNADRRSDVYSIGVILYELLTGELPFRGSRHMLMQQVLVGEPRTPRKINDKIPRDLETICLKCMAKQRQRRYTSGRELAEELQRYLRGEPIKARPAGVGERVLRWGRRHRELLAVTITAAVALVLVGAANAAAGLALFLSAVSAGVAFFLIRRSRFEALALAKEIDALKRANATAQSKVGGKEEHLLIAVRPSGGEQGDITEMARCKSRADNGGSDIQPSVGAYLPREEFIRDDKVAPPGSPEPNAVLVVSPPLRSKKRLWVPAGVYYAAVAVGLTLMWLCVYNLFYWKFGLLNVGYGLNTVIALAVAIAPPMLIIGFLIRLRFRTKAVALAKQRDELEKVFADLRAPAEELPKDVRRQTEKYALQARFDRWISKASYDPAAAMVGSAQLLTGASALDDETLENSIRLRLAQWHGQLPRLRGLVAHHDSIEAVAFSPDSKIVATGSMDKSAGLWTTTGGICLARLPHPSPLNALAFSPAGNAFLTNSGDSTVRLWESPTGKDICALSHQDIVIAVGFNQDGTNVVTACADQKVRLWKTETGQLIASLEHPKAIRTLHFSPDNSTIVTGCDDNKARLWAAASGELLATLEHEGPVGSVRFSPNSKVVLTGSDDRTARVWEKRTGRLLQTCTHKGRVELVRFIPHGEIILTSTDDNNVWLWGIGTLQHEEKVFAAIFSPDSRTVLTATYGKNVRLWDAGTGSPISVLRHQEGVLAVALNPVRQTAITGSADNAARLWDLRTGKLLATLYHPGHVSAVSFSPDGEMALTVCRETLRLWELAPMWNSPQGIPGNQEQIAIWAQVITGLETDLHGAVRFLEPKAWQQRREQLQEFGGPPLDF